MAIGKAVGGGRLVGPRVDAVEAFATSAGAPTTQGTLATSPVLQGVIKKKLGRKLLRGTVVHLGDGTFYLPAVVEVQAILAASESDRRSWMAERFDCDDFAYVLKAEMSVHAYEHAGLKFGLCVGMAWGIFDWVNGMHAVNWFIANDGDLRFIEPQGDVIHDASHCLGDISMVLA